MNRAVWVLTREVNAYDQHGEYFVDVWGRKPTPAELMDRGVLEFEVEHVLAGGGRYKNEDEWFHLNQHAVEDDLVLSQLKHLQTLIDNDRHRVVAGLYGADVAKWRGYQSADLDRLIERAAKSAPIDAADLKSEQFAEMTAQRAAFFMARFKREEKMLGPNEQAAIDFVIKMLESNQATADTEPCPECMYAAFPGYIRGWPCHKCSGSCAVSSTNLNNTKE